MAQFQPHLPGTRPDPPSLPKDSQVSPWGNRGWWRMRNGRLVRLEDMHTTHLQNVLDMQDNPTRGRAPLVTRVRDLMLRLERQYYSHSIATDDQMMELLWPHIYRECRSRGLQTTFPEVRMGSPWKKYCEVWEELYSRRGRLVTVFRLYAIVRAVVKGEIGTSF